MTGVVGYYLNFARSHTGWPSSGWWSPKTRSAKRRRRKRRSAKNSHRRDGEGHWVRHKKKNGSFNFVPCNCVSCPGWMKTCGRWKRHRWSAHTLTSGGCLRGYIICTYREKRTVHLHGTCHGTAGRASKVGRKRKNFVSGRCKSV